MEESKRSLKRNASKICPIGSRKSDQRMRQGFKHTSRGGNKTKQEIAPAGVTDYTHGCVSHALESPEHTNKARC